MIFSARTLIHSRPAPTPDRRGISIEEYFDKSLQLKPTRG